MTNGEKLKELFPYLNIVGTVFTDKRTEQVLAASVNFNWINAEYKEPTTKNDLGVDWENYKDADGNSLDDLILEVLQNNFDCGNTYGYKVADEIIALLPSVTPQEPIIDKIRTDVQNGTHHFLDGEPIIEIKEVLQIIDKYKAESVAEDGNDD